MSSWCCLRSKETKLEEFGGSLDVVSWIDNVAKQSNDRTGERAQACHLLAKPRLLDAPADDASKAHVANFTLHTSTRYLA